MTEQNEWVSLGEAASILGVHPSTVRHWADSGDLPSQRTPGGHRRFRRGDLQQWAILQEGGQDIQTAEAQLMLQNALGRTRLEVMSGQLREQPWYTDMNDDARRSHGRMGRKLLEYLSQFLTSTENSDSIMQDVSRMGADYAELSIKHGLTLSQTLKAFIFFRDMMTESVIQMAEILSLRTPSDWGQRLQQVNRLMDQMLLALVNTYEDHLRT
jgi:excisionase family DNA binding protein